MSISGRINRKAAALERRRRRHRRLAVIGVSMAAALLLGGLWAFLVEPGLLTLTRITIFDDQLPDAWDGRVIALISDAHVGPSFDEERLAKAAEAIAAEQPDLVLFAGDLIDHRTPADDEFTQAVSHCLASMRGRFGQFAILGNHDNRTSAERALAERMLSDGGFQLLDNESVEVDGIRLGGLAECYFGEPDLTRTFPSGEDEWRLLMMHQPDYAAGLPADAADLILSGHTHNGQVAFFDLPLHTVHLGRWYTYGLYDLEDGRQLAVTRGLGTVGVSARFGAPPEVMVITLQQG